MPRISYMASASRRACSPSTHIPVAVAPPLTQFVTNHSSVLLIDPQPQRRRLTEAEGEAHDGHQPLSSVASTGQYRVSCLSLPDVASPCLSLPGHSHSIINGAVSALICLLFFHIEFRNTLLYTLPKKFLLLPVVARSNWRNSFILHRRGVIKLRYDALG